MVSPKLLVQQLGKPTSKTKEKKYLSRNDSIVSHRAKEALRGEDSQKYYLLTVRSREIAQGSTVLQ